MIKNFSKIFGITLLKPLERNFLGSSWSFARTTRGNFWICFKPLKILNSRIGK